MLIYWNKRKHLHERTVQLPEDFLSTLTWPPFHCFATPIWPPWRHVQTLYSVNIALRNGKTSNKNVQLIFHDCYTHESSLHCLATNSLLQVARVGSISASKPVHVAHIACPGQTCFAARDAPPAYGVTSRVVLSNQKSVFTLHASTWFVAGQTSTWVVKSATSFFNLFCKTSCTFLLPVLL